MTSIHIKISIDGKVTHEVEAQVINSSNAEKTVEHLNSVINRLEELKWSIVKDYYPSIKKRKAS